MSGPAHAGYIRAVAAALEAAGVPVADWRADDGVPRDGWIPFDLARQVRLHGRPVWDHDQAGAGWSEEDGWHLLTVDDPGGRDIRVARPLNVATVAAPSSVARAVTGLAGIRHGGPATDSPGRDPSAGGFAVREVDADFAGRRAGTGDPAFEAALRRYSAGRTKCVDGWPDAAEGRG
ncbi:hypothetical protein GCM10010112_27980 [Actinoplanes lobatus]|uniref:DUF6292 domain-containing protein n=1 Tax=Actinoplanes lobatus TaxID=113568 RepID=A0A7W7HPV4_9ACTN|nr:DUF6292 family protein [Actinoplanes lobatus]MBB4754508.1 hypothetical protein [Actinoplanes lobatus]GGN65999.1 hypothetical protein GCM10010112_27980 [Actinoplanes lobatus]GIE40417.1 hypothetical protein Alo02nite_33150 [Actinoplanes lobatus]